MNYRWGSLIWNDISKLGLIGRNGDKVREGMKLCVGYHGSIFGKICGWDLGSATSKIHFCQILFHLKSKKRNCVQTLGSNVIWNLAFRWSLWTMKTLNWRLYFSHQWTDASGRRSDKGCGVRNLVLSFHVNVSILGFLPRLSFLSKLFGNSWHLLK